MYKILIVEEGKRLESMSMKLLELIILKNNILRCIGFLQKFFSKEFRIQWIY